MKRAQVKKSGYRGSDRRGAFRKQAAFPSDITRVNTLRFQRKWNHEVGVNIGLGGMCIRSTKPLPEKANITIAVLLHNEHAELVELDAKLVWTQQRTVDRQKLYYMGLEFTNLSAQAHDLIQRFINEKL